MKKAAEGSLVPAHRRSAASLRLDCTVAREADRNMTGKLPFGHLPRRVHRIWCGAPGVVLAASSKNSAPSGRKDHPWGTRDICFPRTQLRRAISFLHPHHPAGQAGQRGGRRQPPAPQAEEPEPLARSAASGRFGRMQGSGAVSKPAHGRPCPGTGSSKRPCSPAPPGA